MAYAPEIVPQTPSTVRPPRRFLTRASSGFATPAGLSRNVSVMSLAQSLPVLKG